MTQADTATATDMERTAQMRNFLLTIAYDGSGFFGWQRQPGVRTVQGEIETALTALLGQPVTVHGTSRTDAGVHALGQQASFCGVYGIPTDKLQKALNDRLAGQGGGIGKLGRVGDVRILDVKEVPADFHARFSARGKRYCYRIRLSREPDIFQRRYCYQLAEPLDIEAMNEAAAYLVGTHDFRSFQASGSNERLTTVRTLYGLRIEQGRFCGAGKAANLGTAGKAADTAAGTGTAGKAADTAAGTGTAGKAADTAAGTGTAATAAAAAGMASLASAAGMASMTGRTGGAGTEAADVVLTVSGDGFLYNMVRIITGTLVEVGLGRRKPSEMEAILAACDRQKAGHTAPPQGLYLAEVFYDAASPGAAEKE